MFDMNHRQDVKKNILETDYVFSDSDPVEKKKSIYGEHAILHIMENDHVEEAMEMLWYAVNWYEHPHPWGRKHEGEPDFVALRLICAIYEPECYSKLSDEMKDAIKTFFLEKVFRSKHGSENHWLIFHTSLCLAAQFYQGECFKQYGITAEDCYEKELAYLHDFLDYRAGKGWGEFDSLGYAMITLETLATLHHYIKDAGLKNKCHMAMDIILLDQIADSLGEYYGGAHGRSYPDAVIDRTQAPMVKLYQYYFGGVFHKEITLDSLQIYLSDYVPSPIVYEIVENKSKLLPYENREKKHLHLVSVWGLDVDWKAIEREQGSINKYTYVCEDYAIGSVELQEDYAPETKDSWYARHQQHEWELTLPGGGEHKIFSHHSAVADVYRINNRWTGDNRCCCGSFYTNKNTAIAMYNIDNHDAQPLINAFVPLDIFEEKILEEKYLFFKYDNLYISLYFDNDYRINQEDEFANRELLSEGWQNAVVCRVEYAKEYASLEEFAESMKAKPVIFDRELRKVNFDGIEVRRDGNSENGVENIYPYRKVYDCPFMQSVWNSRIIEVKSAKQIVLYDFVRNEMQYYEA